MKDYFFKHKFGVLLIIPGIIAGFFYWKYVGCMNGTCPLTSTWHSTVFFGGLIGYFIGDGIDDAKKKREKKEEDGKV